MPFPMSMPTPTPPAAEPSLEILNPSANEIFTFVSSIVASLIWPAVVIFLVLWFRKSLRGMIDGLSKRVVRLKRVTAPWGIEAEFEDEVEDVAQRARELPALTDTDLVDDAELAPQATNSIPLQLAKIDPAAAIVAAFIPVEEAVREYTEARGFDIEHRNPISEVRRDVNLPRDLRALLSDMSSVRNAAAHRRDLDVSFETARAYVESAEEVAHRVRVVTAQVRFGIASGVRPRPVDRDVEP